MRLPFLECGHSTCPKANQLLATLGGHCLELFASFGLCSFGLAAAEQANDG